MTRAEIMKRIYELTEQGKAYAKAHADEISASHDSDKKIAAERIEVIMNTAENAKKHSWNVYESFRSQIAALGVDSETYETAVIRLTRILNV